jgi:hypothetical protein
MVECLLNMCRGPELDPQHYKKKNYLLWFTDTYRSLPTGSISSRHLPPYYQLSVTLLVLLV